MTQSNTVDKKIVICNTCKGTGAVSQRVSVDEDESFQCESCCGSGLLVEVIETKYYVYKPDATLKPHGRR
jgi:DnaJ-class molecular chaperone